MTRPACYVARSPTTAQPYYLGTTSKGMTLWVQPSRADEYPTREAAQAALDAFPGGAGGVVLSIAEAEKADDRWRAVRAVFAHPAIERPKAEARS